MTKRPAKLARKDAQHSLEYIILITLIMAGIIIGGPYVIRSWNAQMKGWEDSVRDSMIDPLEESPNVLTSVAGGCDPNPWATVGCAMGATDSKGIVWNCSATQFLQTRTYTPLNCETTLIPIPTPNTVQCLTHTCCCTAPQPTGFCGAQDNTLVGAAVALCAGPVFDQPLNVDNTCPDGTMKSWVLCGADADPADRRYGCMNNLACVFNCQVPVGGAPPNTLPAYGALCGGDDTGLLADTNYTYVNAGAGNCTPATKCEVQCSPTFVPSGASCACPLGWSTSGSPAICCPPGQTESAGVCVCAPGYVKACPDGSGGYIAGQCYQGSTCGATECEQ